MEMYYAIQHIICSIFPYFGFIDIRYFYFINVAGSFMPRLKDLPWQNMAQKFIMYNLLTHMALDDAP